MLTFRELTLIAAAGVAGVFAYTAKPAAVVPAGPAPQEIIEILQGTPFTVPPGQSFVATALGSSGGQTNQMVLFVDGQIRLYREPSSIGSGALTMIAIPQHMVIGAGSVITLQGVNPPPGSGQCWGYLVVDD